MYLHVLEKGNEENAAIAKTEREQLDVVFGAQAVNGEGNLAEAVEQHEPDCH